MINVMLLTNPPKALESPCQECLHYWVDTDRCMHKCRLMLHSASELSYVTAPTTGHGSTISASCSLINKQMQLEFASIKGIKNKFFGDSLFLAQLHGPGHVWLQSMTPAKLAAAIEPYLPDNKSSSDN